MTDEPSSPRAEGFSEREPCVVLKLSDWNTIIGILESSTDLDLMNKIREKSIKLIPVVIQI